MTTQEVASRLVELCRQGQIETAQTELYSDDCNCLEPENAPMRNVTGLPAIIEKSKHFNEMVEEFHGATISDPLVAGNYFSISWLLDVTMKGMGRIAMDEICVYQVKDGKIVCEQFFY
jgi:hypothetical protein